MGPENGRSTRSCNATQGWRNKPIQRRDPNVETLRINAALQRRAIHIIESLPNEYTAEIHWPCCGDRIGDTGSSKNWRCTVRTALCLRCWLTQDRDAAEDLVQETLLKALKGFSSFQQGSNFRAWIHRILRNTFSLRKPGSRRLSHWTRRTTHSGTSTSITPESLFSRVSLRSVERALINCRYTFRVVCFATLRVELPGISLAVAFLWHCYVAPLARAQSLARALTAKQEGLGDDV